MTITEMTLADLALNTVYDNMKFATLTRFPLLIVKKIIDDGVTSTIQLLDADNNVQTTQQYDTTKYIWQVNL